MEQALEQLVGFGIIGIFLCVGLIYALKKKHTGPDQDQRH